MQINQVEDRPSKVKLRIKEPLFTQGGVAERICIPGMQGIARKHRIAVGELPRTTAPVIHADTDMLQLGVVLDHRKQVDVRISVGVLIDFLQNDKIDMNAFKELCYA